MRSPTCRACCEITDPPGLSAKAREPIRAPGNAIGVGAVTVGEISIEPGLGRGGMPVSGKPTCEFLPPRGIPTYRRTDCLPSSLNTPPR